MIDLPALRTPARLIRNWIKGQVRLWAARSDVYTHLSFFIIGAQKSGTSALHRYLCKHPDILPGSNKEIHFFDRDKNYHRGLNWYHRHFPLLWKSGEGRVTLDASPSYIYHRKTPERIYKYSPHAKMILLLRDPVERAYSAWNFFRRIHKTERFPYFHGWFQVDADGREGMRRLLEPAEYPSFEEAVREEINNSMSEGSLPEPSFVRRGLYAEQIERYFNYFDRDQIMIIDSRRLRRETTPTLADIATFVGLRPHDWDRDLADMPQMNSVYEAPLSQEGRDCLATFYRPHNERLYELLGHDFGW
jgi:hypothetical protein